MRRASDKALARGPSSAEPMQHVSSASESLLLARLRAGEDAAYRELLRIDGGRLLAVARRLMRNEEDTRDCLRDTFPSACGLRSTASRPTRSSGPGCTGSW